MHLLGHACLQVEAHRANDADVEALRVWLKGEEADALAAANEPDIQAAVTDLADAASASDEPVTPLLQSESLVELRKELEPWLESHGYDGFVVVDARRVIIAAHQDYLVGNASLAQDVPFLDRVFEGKTTVSAPFKSVLILKDFDGQMRAGVPPDTWCESGSSPF